MRAASFSVFLVWFDLPSFSYLLSNLKSSQSSVLAASLQIAAGADSSAFTKLMSDIINEEYEDAEQPGWN